MQCKNDVDLYKVIKIIKMWKFFLKPLYKYGKLYYNYYTITSVVENCKLRGHDHGKEAYLR